MGGSERWTLAADGDEHELARFSPALLPRAAAERRSDLTPAADSILFDEKPEVCVLLKLGRSFERSV